MLNTRVSVVYIETWQNTNQAMVDRNQDISRALLNFNDYTSRKLFKIDKDTTQLLSWVLSIFRFFDNHWSGKSAPINKI